MNEVAATEPVRRIRDAEPDVVVDPELESDELDCELEEVVSEL